jgi:hypothetical protein
LRNGYGWDAQWPEAEICAFESFRGRDVVALEL